MTLAALRYKNKTRLLLIEGNETIAPSNSM